MTGKPKTMLELSQMVIAGQKPINDGIKEFIDEFIANPYLTLIEDEPELLNDAAENAYLAGIAEYMAFWIDEEKPAWTENSERFLKSVVFFGAENISPQMQQDTPFSFRRRLLFCGDTMSKIKTMLSSNGRSPN